MQAIEIEFAADDNDSRATLLAACKDSVATEPMYFAGETQLISIVIPLTLHALHYVMQMIKAHLESKKYIKVKLPGGLEISGASLREIKQVEDVLSRLAKK